MNRAIWAIPAAALIAGCSAASPPPAKPSATVPPAPAATVSTPASALSAIQSWYASGGHAALTQLTAALGAASHINPANPATADRACRKISTAVTTAQEAGPVPYKPAERWFARALAQYSVAAADCQAAAQSGDVAMIRSSSAHLGRGSADLVKATSAIRKLDG